MMGTPASAMRYWKYWLFGTLVLADGALTLFLIHQGDGTEVNWYQLFVNDPVLFIVVKVVAAILVMVLLVRFHKVNLLKYINIGMLCVVLMSVVSLAFWLSGRFA